MFPAYQHLSVALKDGVIALASLNRPEAAGALNTPMALDIKHFFTLLPQSGCRAVILSGKGRHFCAGADLKERRGMDEASWQRQHEAFEEAHRAILDCPVPVIAAVHGAAFAGGLELALACDFLYASDDARFAMTEATLGIMPGLGGTQLLPRRAGISRAKEILFTGKPFSAKDAFAWGIANKLCKGEKKLQAEALATAKDIAKNAPLAVRAMKRAMRQGMDLPLADALACELSHYGRLLSTKDRFEGIKAYNEKRKPAFTGE